MKPKWNTVRLDELCEIRTGRTPRRDTPEFWGGTAVWVTIRELTGGVIRKSKEQVSDYAVKKVMGEPLPNGTLLFSFKLSIGKTGITGCPLYTNEAIAALLIRDPKRISRDFLHYVLKATSFESGANTAVMGKVLNKEKVSAIPIPLPPLPEQQRIVSILDEADALRQLRARADTRTNDFIPALFNEMFGDPATNPKGWKVFSLSEVGTLDRGRSRNRPRDEPSLYGGAYPFIQTGDVANADGVITKYTQMYSELGLAQSRMWPTGTLCITIAANIGKTAILSFPACFPDSMVGFIPGDNVSAEYVRQWFVTIEQNLDESATQSAQKNINLKVLRELPIPLPPLALQREFAARVAEVRALQAQQVRSRQRLEDLFQALLHRAFAGEL